MVSPIEPRNERLLIDTDEEYRNADPNGAPDSDEISLLSIANFLIGWRRLVGATALAGLIVGAAVALLPTRQYTSAAVFLPSGEETEAPSGLAAAASQFGIRLQKGSSSWGPPIYVELLGSHALLEPLSRDTVSMTEKGKTRVVRVADLVAANNLSPQQRTDRIV